MHHANESVLIGLSLAKVGFKSLPLVTAGLGPNVSEFMLRIIEDDRIEDKYYPL
jgi:hypothetical protein